MFEFVVEFRTFRRVFEDVVGVRVGDEAFSGDGDGDLSDVDGDPAAAPFLGLVGHGTGPACEVEDEVAWVGGHQEAAFQHLGWGFNDILLVSAVLLCRSRRRHFVLPGISPS